MTLGILATYLPTLNIRGQRQENKRDRPLVGHDRFHLMPPNSQYETIIMSNCLLRDGQCPVSVPFVPRRPSLHLQAAEDCFAATIMHSPRARNRCNFWKACCNERLAARWTNLIDRQSRLKLAERNRDGRFAG